MMAKTAPLDQPSLDRELTTLTHWKLNASGLFREFVFDRYDSAVAFVVRLAMLAERLDHHPEITLGWCRVSVRWITHDFNAITQRDINAAHATDSLT